MYYRDLYLSKFLFRSLPLQSYLKFVFLFLLLCILELPVAFAQEGIVYSRCERTTATYELTGTVTINGQTQTITRTMKGLDVYDVLPDVTNFLTGFTAPCDLVYRDPAGVETVIYDCSSTSTQASSCAALDPSVSFDGKTIAFSVFRGSLKNHTEPIDTRVLHPDADKADLGWHTLPNKKLQTTGAHLHFYSIETQKTVTIPFTASVYDSGPAFISNTRVAFTSTRDEHTTTVVWGSTGSRIGTRIWTVDIDGKNPDLASHHSLSQEQHPFMLRDGRLAYSSWQIFGGLPFRYGNGTPGGFTTLDNLFHIYAQDPDGAGNFPIYGQHSGEHKASYFGEDHVAAHFITQTSDNRVWFTDYYRGNNNGLGALIGVIPEPKGQEGISPQEANHHGDFYVPRDVINFAAWTNNGDNMSMALVSPAITHPNYKDSIPFAGRVGHPSALPNNDLMLVWGKGACSTVAGSQVYSALGKPVPPATSGWGGGVAMNVITSLNMDIPGCDAGIYRATTIPSNHPNDLQMIVDSPDWHEIMARAVVPYSAIHGVDHPNIIERSDIRTTHASLVTGTPFGLLGAASITDRETHPEGGIHFAGEHQFNLQGTDTIDYTDDELCGVRILGNMPNRSSSSYFDIANYAGERVSILGELPVLNRNADGTRAIDTSGHPDTSFLVRMPANTPYMMQGIDCDGRTLNTDQTWQSLRPGEVKTCDGCHVHSGTPRTQFKQTFAATTNYTIPRLGEGTVPLLTGKSGNTVNTRSVPGYGMQIEFTRDIKPIFDQHCIACHGGSSPAAGLALDITGGVNNAPDTTWWCLVADRKQSCVAADKQMDTGAGLVFRRPQLTRYIRAFNSRGSLLYWKAANQRTDNRTDSQYADDIDFGAAHPTSITADELGLLSRWIDIGAPGGTKELLDTQKPTLHLATADSNGSLSQLRVGTIDLGSGIDPSSLWVCVRGSDGSCNNLAGAAEKHGVTIVNLGGSLSDPNTEIYARVYDMAGNKTEVFRSVRWFLNNGTPKLPDSGTDTQSPSISITSPIGGEISGIVPVTVSYTDNVAVTSVDFYVNGSLHSTSTQEPFTFNLDTTQLIDGHSYILNALAFDAASNQSISNNVTVTINNTETNPSGTVKEDTEAPVISFASPTGGTVSGIVPVSFNYSDNVAVTAVELYVNGQLYSNSTQEPFTFTIDTTRSADGDYMLSAKAFDAAGNQGVSGNIAISINNTSPRDTNTDTEAPVISFALPTGGAVSGIIPVSFNYSDNVAVTAVDLYVNGQLYGHSTQEPFAFTIDTTGVTDGDYMLTANAFDAAGNLGASNNLTISVKNTVADTEAPVINIVSPTAGNVAGKVYVDVVFSDNVAVTHIDYFINGLLFATSKQEPFGFSMDTASVADGDYVLSAKAFDAAGNQGASNEVTVTVKNTSTADIQAPTVAIMSPTSGDGVAGNIWVSVDAFDDIGVSHVDLYIDGRKYSSDNQAPYQFRLNTKNFLKGSSHVLTAHALDKAGNEGVSGNIVISVK